MKVEVQKIEIPMLVCNKCGKQFEDSYDFCPYCDSKDLMTKNVVVDAVRCENCGALIPCVHSNFLMGSRFKIIACPYCFEKSNKPTGQRVIAIYYRKSWWKPDFFLTYKGRDGIYEVKSQRDKITLQILNSDARAEEASFKRIDFSLNSKILWQNGRAIGYYVYSFEDYPKPVMHQIFVRKEERHKGYGSRMLMDFLEQFKPQKVLFETPISPSFGNLLVKLNLCKREHDGTITSLGRIGFVRLGF